HKRVSGTKESLAQKSLWHKRVSGTKESLAQKSLWHKRVSGTKEFSDTKVAWIYDEMKKDSSVTTKLLSERSGIPLRTVRRAIDELTEKGYVIRDGGRKSAMGRLR
ncbi:MAG: winged helix-turn-helix domain-containing protein, partial [Prevotella sp.]|nr:winged helix-turn-helix domain-containing protein [Prevotella sp.]